MSGQEKELLKKWAKNNFKGGDFLHNQNTTSCFVKRDGDEKYIREYGFESVSELRDLLEVQWKKDRYMEEILTVVLVAAIKNKPEQRDANCQRHPNQMISEETEMLPVYIYNF